MTAQLAAEGPVVALPILTRVEALITVELLEQLIETCPSQKVGELARTLIVRVLDRLDADTGEVAPKGGVDE